MKLVMDEEIEALALNIFGSSEKAHEWLNTKHMLIKMSPAEYLKKTNGKNEVLKILHAIAYGGVV